MASGRPSNTPRSAAGVASSDASPATRSAPITARAMRVTGCLPSRHCRRRHLHHVVEERTVDLREPVRHAVGHDHHVALDQLTGLAAADRRAANLVHCRRLAVDHRASGDQRRRAVEHVDDVGIARVDLRHARRLAPAGVDLVLAGLEQRLAGLERRRHLRRGERLDRTRHGIIAVARSRSRMRRRRACAMSSSWAALTAPLTPSAPTTRPPRIAARRHAAASSRRRRPATCGPC